MPTRLLLEGGDLQELLAQVREEHGTRAKIVSAERVRAGGLTGLLRAERYELTVELSDDEPAEAPVPVGAVASGAQKAPARAAQATPPAAGSVVGSQAQVTHTAAAPATTPRQTAAPQPAPTPTGPTGGGTAGGGTTGGGMTAAGNGATAAGAVGGGSVGNGGPGSSLAPIGKAGNGVAATNLAANQSVPGNGMGAYGPSGNGMGAYGPSGNGMAANGMPANGMAGNVPGNGAANNGMPGHGMAGNGMPGHGMAGNGMAGNGMAGNGMVGLAGNAGRQADAPAGRPEQHGPDVDELLALLEQREAATPDSSSVGASTAPEVPGGPPAGFDEVLAELRGVGAPAIAAANGVPTNPTAGTTNGAAQAPNGTGHSNGTGHGPANGIATNPAAGVANGQAAGVATNAAAGIATNPALGVANGQAAGIATNPAAGVANGQAAGVHNPAAGIARGQANGSPASVGDQQVQNHVQSAQTPPSAIHSAIESALPAVLRQETAPVSAETVEFSMDPIFAPAKGAPEAPPAPAAARTHTVPPPAPAQPGAPNGSTHTPKTAGRPTANPARTRPLSPDPRRPNHFMSYGDLESIPTETPLPQKLADLGLPQRMIDRLPVGEAYPSIVRALLDEPDAPPLPSGPGTIITIIGELAGALAVAEDVARLLRLDADRILIASESPQVGRHIADPGDAGRQAARLRGGDQPRLVCVDAPAPTSWVQQVVVALRPDAVWCAVDATRKPADVARQLRSLPRVDALAVHQLEATADPASPLALGVPVALLDGQPAGPHGWAALLCRRLFEEEFSGGDR